MTRQMPTSAATAELTSLAKILDLANVIIHDVDGRILYWTSGCERLYGWSRAEALGQIVHELLGTKYPHAAAGPRKLPVSGSSAETRLGGGHGRPRVPTAELRRAAGSFTVGHDRSHAGDLEGVEVPFRISKRDIFALGEAMGLQMNSLLFALLILPVIFNEPRRAASAPRTMEKHAASLAVFWPETPDATMRLKLCPFLRVQVTRGVDWRDDLIPTVKAARGEL
jgi:hypothetical protein